MTLPTRPRRYCDPASLDPPFPRSQFTLNLPSLSRPFLTLLCELIHLGMNGMFGMGLPGMDNSNVSDVTTNSLDVTDNIEISRASSQQPIHAGKMGENTAAKHL